MTRHPRQPVVVDKNGVHRYKRNAIVCFLLDDGPFDMNHLARISTFTDEDREQFAQLIGYSVSGASHSFAESAAKERDEALLQHAMESGRRAAAEAERDEARASLAGRGMSCTPDLDWVRLKAERDRAIAELDAARGKALEEAARHVEACTAPSVKAESRINARTLVAFIVEDLRALAAKGGA